MNKFAKERGGSLIEVIVASAVLIIIVVGTFASFTAITNYSRQAKFTQSLTAIAKEELNRVRAVSKVKPLPETLPYYTETSTYTNKNYYNLQTLPQAGEQLVTYDNIYSQKDNNADAKFPVYRRITFATVNAGSDKEYKRVTVSLRDSFQPPRFSTTTFTTNISKPVVYDTRTTVDRGYLAGKVIDRDTNAPVDGATVKITRVGYPDTTISSNGAIGYSIELPVGNYTVKADKPLVNGYWSVTVTPVTVSGGYTTTTQNFSLQPFYYGIIKVTIRHADTSAPLGGILVWLQLISAGSYTSRNTDANGEVVFTSVLINQREVTSWIAKYRIQAQSNSLYWASLAPSVDVEKDVTNSYTLTMIPKRFANLNFTVQRKDESAFKISGSRVDLQGDNIVGSSPKYTDVDGRASYQLTVNQTATQWKNGKYLVSRDGYQALSWVNINPDIDDNSTREITVELELSTLLASIDPPWANITSGAQQLFTGYVSYNGIDKTAACTKSWELTPGTTIGYLNSGGLTAGNYNAVTYMSTSDGFTRLTFRASITIGGILFTAQKSINIFVAPTEGPSIFNLILTPTAKIVPFSSSYGFVATAYFNNNPVSVAKNWRIVSPGIGSFDTFKSALYAKTTSGVNDSVIFWGDMVGSTQMEVTTTYLGTYTDTELADITVEPLNFLAAINPGSVTIPPGGTQTFTATASYGANVSASTIFEWWVGNGSFGTLSTTSGPTVTFTANSSVGEEYLNLRATYTPTDGTPTKILTPSITINIQPGGGFVQ
ncbi:MAG: carboxypeptidase-like regulatory domain-containing protein [Elusimicrobiota bacterium]